MENRPLFSVIIPTYNRPRQLTVCLESLVRLEYPRDRFEVIVVDDGSDRPLDAVVAPFQAALTLTLIRQLNAGPAPARNHGARQAQGRYLAFTDDDCQPAVDWLQALERRVTACPEHIVGGQTQNLLPHNLYSTTSQNIVSVVYEHYNPDPDRACFFASNNLVIPADKFREIGGFNQDFRTSEDRELCDRWLHRGYRMTYAPEVVIYHAHPMSLKSFWRQHFSYGRGAFYFHKLRAQENRGRFQVEGNYYLTLLRYPFVNGQAKQGVTLTAAQLVAQVANAAGFFWTMLRHSESDGNNGSKSGDRLDPSHSEG